MYSWFWRHRLLAILEGWPCQYCKVALYNFIIIKTSYYNEILKFLLNDILIFRDIVRARPNAGLYIANCPFHVSRYKWVLTISIWHVNEIIISLSFWFESCVWWRGITEFDMFDMVRCAVRKRIEECHKTDSTFKHTHWSVKAINWSKQFSTNTGMTWCDCKHFRQNWFTNNFKAPPLTLGQAWWFPYCRRR